MSEHTLALDLGPDAEVRRLVIQEGECLAIVLPEGVPMTYELLDRCQRSARTAELPFRILFFEHGTDLRVVGQQNPWPHIETKTQTRGGGSLTVQAPQGSTTGRFPTPAEMHDGRQTPTG